ncbi:MAG: pre-peptidase C-terminal domain-containing protein, partial [Anaerolineae bacterium]|nr:pre-peptidase C-terminal domain-containing protein [Anaerolineae bacterium]
ARPTAPRAEAPSPTVAGEGSATPAATKGAAPSPTARAESPTPGSTLAVPPTIPSGHPTAMAEGPVVPDEWEPDDSPEDASPIEMGGVQGHNLHVGGDQDWLYFEVEAGRSYVIETANLGREIDTVVSLYDSSGNQLSSDDDGGEEFGSSRLFWVVEEGGRVYVMVRGLADTEEGAGTGYEVSVRVAEGFRMDEYEPDDSPAQATRIEVGETQRHNRHVSGDEDWISFQAEAGSTYVIETSRLGDRADTVVYLYDAQGNVLALDDDGGDEARASRLRWTAPSSGSFFVKVGNWLPSWAGPGTGYDLTLRVPQGD